MDEATGWRLLTTERRALADLLDGLTPAQWETPSLCGEWTVKGVAVHLSAGPAGVLREFVTAMVAARGSFARANVIMVERQMHRPTSEIVADVRTYAEDRFAPPGMGWRAPLTDFLVHRLDITVPLGIDHGRSPHLWPDALDFLLSRKARRGFVDAGQPPLAYAATDVAWTHGSGAAVSGPADVLALALTRRPRRLDELTGPGADELRRWAVG